MADLNGGVVGVDNPTVAQPEVITTFNSSGTLSVNTLGVDDNILEFLVIAGGGGGAAMMLLQAIQLL